MKIQVGFNPARVASYRLIGDEKRILRKEDFNNDKIDAGEIGAGHSVTALYEVVPVGTEPNPAASVPPVDPLKCQATTPARSVVRQQWFAGDADGQVGYKEPDGVTSKLLERPFLDAGMPFVNAAPDLKFTAAVAEFGMTLRDSEYKGNGSLGAVAEWGAGRQAQMKTVIVPGSSNSCARRNGYESAPASRFDLTCEMVASLIRLKGF